MNKLILGCDAHRHYSVFVGLREDSLAESSNIANESTGHWYWLVDGWRRATIRIRPQPLIAKRRMGRTY